MRQLIFVSKINGKDETGLIDVLKSPPELYCLCNEEVGKEIQSLTEQLQKANEIIDQLNNPHP